MSKIKCDGKLPACSACEKSGRTRQCSNANDEFVKGKERSYIASLEARRGKLEEQVSRAKARRASDPVLAILPTKATMSSTSRVFDHSRKIQTKEASDIDDLVSDFGFLQVFGLSKPLSNL